MKAEIKEKWLEALRSGKYEQGRARLKTEHGNILRFCCLGVLCEVVKNEIGLEVSGEYYGKGGSDVYLPPEVVEYAELSSGNPLIKYKDYQSIAEINDDGKDFLEIANVIEEQL